MTIVSWEIRFGELIVEIYNVNVCRKLSKRGRCFSFYFSFSFFFILSFLFSSVESIRLKRLGEKWPRASREAVAEPVVLGSKFLLTNNVATLFRCQPLSWGIIHPVDFITIPRHGFLTSARMNLFSGTGRGVGVAARDEHRAVKP